MAIHFESYSLFWKYLPIISKTPLHLAAWYGHVEVAKLLVECGAEVSERENCEHAICDSLQNI